MKILSIIFSLMVTVLLVASGIVYAQNSPAKKKVSPQWIKANEHYEAGNGYTKSENWNLAIEEYSKTVEILPGIAQTYNSRAFAYAQKGQFDEALADLNTAIKLKPDNPKPYFNRGIIYGQRKSWDKAIADYSKVLEINPNHIKARKARADAFEKK